MAGYIIRDREKTLALPARQVDQLLAAADGDAALLYLYLMRAEDAVTAAQLMEKLSMSALRLQGAQTKLEKMGLIQAQGLPLPEPEQRPAEYTAADLMQLLRDPEFEMLVGETERSLGKKLTTMDLKRLANLRHEVGLPADVIFLLVRHCVEEQERRFGPGRRPTVGAIEKEGYYWAKGACSTRNPPPDICAPWPGGENNRCSTWRPCTWVTAARWRRRRSISPSGWTGAFRRRWWPWPMKRRC